MDRGRLAHYRIISRLGAGGMGEVYRARDEQLDRDVAVKVLPASSFGDPTARARLVREARAAAALNHPNICTVYEVGEAEGQAYIAMELVEGRTLSALLHAGPLPAEHVVHYGRQLADALTHAHERGVIHRDLKSNNVIVTPDRRVKVLDFGLAKRAVDSDMTAAVTEIHASLTQAGTAVGTLPYMSPEQLRGDVVRVSSDIWALGVVLYEMATGVRPFTGSLLPMLLLSLVSAMIVPGGLFMRMLGHAVVTRSGSEISRTISLARVLVAWAPAIAWLLYLASSPKVQGFVPTPPSPTLGALVTLAALGIGAALTIARPERAPHDWLLGTWVVPR